MKAIFFDTNVFYKIKFDIDNSKMVKVINLAKDLKVELWISPITIEEIRAGINKKIEELNTAYKNANLLLKNAHDDIELLDIEKVEFARENALNEIDLFIEQNEFKIIDYSILDETDIAKIFSEYFRQNGVFTPKKRSKKVISKEFPDAFQLELVKRKIKTHEEIFILSEDMDFANGFEQDKNIFLHKSLESIEKDLQSMSDANGEKISFIESTVLFHIDAESTHEQIYSELVLMPYNCISESDVDTALLSLIKKGFIEASEVSDKPSEYNIRKIKLSMCI